MSNLENFVAIAERENGVVETPTNRTKYGEWYGLNGVPWCAIFVSWCASKAGMLNESVPKFAGCKDGVSWYSRRNKYKKRGYAPKRGDIIFFGTDGGTHVGIVRGYNPSTKQISTVEGNSSDRVAFRTYDLNAGKIHGFGILNEGSSDYIYTHLTNIGCNVADNIEFTHPVDELEKGDYVFIESTNSNGISKIWYGEDLEKTGYVPFRCFDAAEDTNVMEKACRLSTNKEFTSPSGYALDPGEKIAVISSNGETAKVLCGEKLDKLGYVLLTHIKATHVMKDNCRLSTNKEFTSPSGYALSAGDKICIINTNPETAKVLCGEKLEKIGYVRVDHIETTHVMEASSRIAENVGFTVPSGKAVEPGDKICMIKTTGDTSKVLCGKDLEIEGYVLNSKIKATHVMKGNSRISRNVEFTSPTGDTVATGDKVCVIRVHEETSYVLYGNEFAKAGYVLNSLLEVYNGTGSEVKKKIYVVQVGLFASKANADKMIADLKSKGIDACIKTITEGDKTTYRVQVGAFSVKENAQKMLVDLKAKGIDGYVREE